MGEVLAHAFSVVEHIQRGGGDGRDALDVVETVTHAIDDRHDREERRALTEGGRPSREVLVKRHVRRRREILSQAIAVLVEHAPT